MPPTSRRASVLAALAALALLAGACGDDDDAASTTTTTEAGGGATTTEAGDDEDERPGEPSDLTADDLLEAVERTRAADSATVQLDAAFDGGDLFGSQHLRLGGPVAFDGQEGDIVLEIVGEEGSVRIVLAEGTAWVGGDQPEVSESLPDDAEWAELPIEDLLASEGFSYPGDLAYLYLVGGAEDIREDGDVIRFDIDLAAAVESAPEELRNEVGATVTFTGGREPIVTGAARLDDEGRITSLVVEGVQRPTTEEAENLGIGEDEELQITLEVAISDFDEPIDVSAPDGEVVPISEAPQLAALLGITTS